MSRKLKDFDEALEAWRLGNEVQFSTSGFGNVSDWKPVFQKVVQFQGKILLDEHALGACVNFRVRPEPRVEEIMTDMFDSEPAGKGRKNWRSVRGAKKAVREVLASLQGSLPREKLKALEREYCGDDE